MFSMLLTRFKTLEVLFGEDLAKLDLEPSLIDEVDDVAEDEVRDDEESWYLQSWLAVLIELTEGERFIACWVDCVGVLGFVWSFVGVSLDRLLLEWNCCGCLGLALLNELSV